LATQFFSDEQMERLRSYPDIGREELIRFFTLTRKDLGFVDNLERGGGRGSAARLGLAVQLCTLPWLGFVPDDLWSVPQAAVLRLANQLAVFPDMYAAPHGIVLLPRNVPNFVWPALCCSDPLPFAIPAFAALDSRPKPSGARAAATQHGKRRHPAHRRGAPG